MSLWVRSSCIRQWNWRLRLTESSVQGASFVWHSLNFTETLCVFIPSCIPILCYLSEHVVRLFCYSYRTLKWRRSRNLSLRIWDHFNSMEAFIQFAKETNLPRVTANTFVKGGIIYIKRQLKRNVKQEFCRFLQDVSPRGECRPDIDHGIDYLYIKIGLLSLFQFQLKLICVDPFRFLLFPPFVE